MIRTVVRPRSRALTTLARLWSEFHITTADAARDTLIASLILEASDLIMKEVGYEFFRARLTESLTGSGRSELLLSRTPVAQVESVIVDGVEVDASLYQVDPDLGVAFHSTAWPNTKHIGVAITAFERPDEGEHVVIVDYWAGVFGPDEDINASGLAVFGGSDSFAVDDPPLLVPGDVIETTGFAEADNNGMFPVLRRTASGIEVGGDLVTEVAAPATARIKVRSLDRTFERLCVQTVKAWFIGSDSNPAVTAEKIGDWSVRYGADNDGSMHELPPGVISALDRYRRFV